MLKKSSKLIHIDKYRYIYYLTILSLELKLNQVQITISILDSRLLISSFTMESLSVCYIKLVLQACLKNCCLMTLVDGLLLLITVTITVIAIFSLLFSFRIRDL